LLGMAVAAGALFAAHGSALGKAPVYAADDPDCIDASDLPAGPHKGVNVCKDSHTKQVKATLATCTSSNPPPGDACQPILTQAIQNHETNGPTRQMYHADPSFYPQSLSSTTPTKLLAKPGALSAWSNANASSVVDGEVPSMHAPGSSSTVTIIPPGLGGVTLSVNTDLTYMSLMLQDYNAARADMRISPLVPLSPSIFRAHKWLKNSIGVGLPTVGSDPNSVQNGKINPYFTFTDSAGSCQEYVWKLWSPVSLAEDRAAACGDDAVCSFTQLYEAGGPGHGDALNVRGSFDRDGGAMRVPAGQTRRPRNPYLGASASYLVDQDIGFFNAMGSFDPKTCFFTTMGPQAYGTQPFVPDGMTVTPDVQAKLDRVRAWLAAQYTYSYGDAYPSSGANDIHFSDEWSFHGRMADATIRSNTVAMLPTEVRLATRQRAQHFKELLARYDALTTFACSHVFHLSTNLPASAPSGGGKPAMQTMSSTTDQASVRAHKIVAAAREIQRQIVLAMIEEYDRGDQGCFSNFEGTDGRGRVDCDWFPEDAAPRAMGAFTAEREHDFATCVRWTSNDFTQPGLQSWDSNKQATVDPDVDGVTGWIQRKYQVAVENLREAPAVDAAIDPHNTSGQTSGRTAIGQVIAGSKYYGDSDWFGGGYSYGTYWKVAPSDFNGDAQQACRLDGSIHGEFNAKVDLLKKYGDDICNACSLSWAGDVGQIAGNQSVTSLCDGFGVVCEARYRMRHLAEAHVDVQSDAAGNKADGDFFFTGEQIWNPGTVDFTTPYHEVFSPDPETIPGFNETVVIIVVPVTLQAYGEVHYGVTLDAHVNNTRSCPTVGNSGQGPSIDLGANFTPWAYVDAFASVGIGFSFAQAGVRGRVRLIDARLPLTASVGIDKTKSLVAVADAHLDVGLLDGSLSLFAQIGEPPVADIEEKELFSWRGYHDSIPIWHTQIKPIALPVFDQAKWDQFKKSAL
jgi:hypothetical protein